MLTRGAAGHRNASARLLDVKVGHYNRMGEEIDQTVKLSWFRQSVKHLVGSGGAHPGGMVAGQENHRCASMGL